MGTDIQQQWNAVKDAPILYISALAAIAVLIWVVITHLKSGRIESLEERIRLRDDEIADYKRKLEGATPDEAAAKIAEAERSILILEEKLRLLQPRQRMIDGPEGLAIRQELEKFPKEKRWQVAAKSGDNEVIRFSQQIKLFMQSNGFNVLDRIALVTMTAPFEGHRIGRFKDENQEIGPIMVTIGEIEKNTQFSQ